jgi:hypothetical protein
MVAAPKRDLISGSTKEYYLDPIITIPETDARELPFDVIDDQGNDVDITNYTIEWQLAEYQTKNVLLDLGDSGVSVTNRNDLSGDFSIKIETDTTNNFELHLYEEYILLTDGNGDQTTYQGAVRIVEGAT